MKQYKYADTDRPVFGRDEFEDNLRMVTEAAIMQGDDRPIEVRVLCANHPDKGLFVIYEDGLLVLGCSQCRKLVGQVEVAERGRDWGKILVH